MLVFEPEITRSLRRDVYYVASVESRPVDLGELMESVKATLPDSVSITELPILLSDIFNYILIVLNISAL